MWRLPTSSLRYNISQHVLASQKPARQTHEGQGGCKPWGRDGAATSISGFSPWHVPGLGSGFTHGHGCLSRPQTVYLRALSGWPLVAVLTPCTGKAGSALVFSSQQMLPQWVFQSPLPAGWCRYQSYFGTTGGREDAAWWFPGLASLLALGRAWALAAVSSTTPWVIAKVWNWCHNKCSGLGKSFEVRPERRDNALFPRLSLSHRCL